MSKEIKKILDGAAGKPLKDFLLKALFELKDIESLSEKGSPTHQAIETKAQKRAYEKLKKIYEDIITISEDPQEKDSRDDYNIY